VNVAKLRSIPVNDLERAPESSETRLPQSKLGAEVVGVAQKIQLSVLPVARTRDGFLIQRDEIEA
jgi:hypothetical protein